MNSYDLGSGNDCADLHEFAFVGRELNKVAAMVDMFSNESIPKLSRRIG